MSNKYRPYLIMAGFGVLFALVSLVNHYNFRTFAFDLGIQNQAFWHYSRFEWGRSTLFQPVHENRLSDHFELWQMLLSPLRYVFGTYALLVLQIVFVLLGGLGVYRLVAAQTRNDQTAVWAMVYFYAMWGIYSALGYDVHFNVFGAMLVPWWLHFAFQRQWRWAALAFVGVLISKENVALWAVFIGLGLAWLRWRERELRLAGLAFALAAGLYTVLVIKFLMPALGSSDGYVHAHFYKEAASSFHPLHLLRHLFCNTFDNPELNGVKAELYITLFVTGGWVLLFRPAYALMLAPIIAQKVLHGDFQKWGLNFHYSIEFVPILAIALFTWRGAPVTRLKFWRQLADRPIARRLPMLAAFVAVIWTIHKMDHRQSKWYRPENERFYQAPHYESYLPREAVREAMALIPSDAALSAYSRILPHVAFREEIYLFPEAGRARYILAVDNPYEPYPLSREQLTEHLAGLRADSSLTLLFDREGVLLFQRK